MIIKGGYMKKKLLVLLIAIIPTLMPNLASAVAIDTGGDWIEYEEKEERGCSQFWGFPCVMPVA